MKPLAPNTLLQNRYLIVHLIGKGGMGEVYLAVDQRLGSAVALKRTLHGEDAALGDAFEREARTLARLRHPALPKVSDHFTENENQFLVMDHIAGDDLSKRLGATQKPFPLSWVLYWADQLLDALAYLHSHEPPIVHRDIKPQNLKLTDDNNIVLLDFGLSKNSIGQTNMAGSTGSGSVVGYTPHYAPMEQVRGTGTNPRSDIYSLSATLYQLLTNVVPPDALSRADFLLSGKNDPIVPINEINQAIPKSISDVVLKGMSISQDQRYSDARTMQKDLREKYAEMQSAATDKPVAAGAQEQPLAPAVKTADFPKNNPEQFSGRGAVENQPSLKEVMGAQTVPFSMLTETPASGAPEAVEIEPTPDFNATLVMDETANSKPTPRAAPPTRVYKVSETDDAPKQSNIKTEVFNGDFGAAEYLQANQNAAPSMPQNITGDKTVPLISFDANSVKAFENEPAGVDYGQTQPASAFDSVPGAENFSTAPASRATAEDYAALNQPAAQFDAGSEPTVTVRPQSGQKKSNGLLIGILAAVFGFFVLAAVGGGAVWYFMSQQSTPPAAESSTPTPLPTASPTPEQTPEQANINSVETSNSEVVTSSSPDNSAVNTAPSPEQTKPVIMPPTSTLRTPTPSRQTPVTPGTPRPATPKPTVKPETKPTLRGTTIPQ